MADSSEHRRNIIRDNVRKMISMGAEPDEVTTYVSFEGQTLPNLSVRSLFQEAVQQHPEQQPGQRLGPTFTLPGSKLREREQRLLTVPETPGDLGSLGAAVGLTVASEFFPPAGPAAITRLANFGREALKQTTGGTIGFTVGDLIEKKARGEQIDAESLIDTGKGALETAMLVAGTATATRGLGEVFAFLRGAGADKTAKRAGKFARETLFENRPLPARAGELAPRSAGGKLDRASQRLSVTARTFAKQQGQKVAQFLETQLTGMSGKPSIVEPTNIVEKAAVVIRNASGRQAQRFGEGVGRNFENAEIWLNQFFSPANSNLMKQIRDGNTDLFNDMKAAWFQSAMRATQDNSIKNAGVMLFNGAEFRAWFEGNRKLIKDIFGDAQEDVMDGFTAYMKFASPTAKRAFADAQLADAAPMATDAALATTGAAFLGPLGAIVPFGTEGVLGAMSWALSRPGNPIYQAFTEATVGLKARGARIIGQGLAVERGLRFRGGEPINRRIKGSRLPMREERTTDPRFVPPVFKGLP